MLMVYFIENYNFPRFQRGFNIFSRGGIQFFLGESNCLFLIDSHITCVFPGGGGGPGPLPPPPKDQRMQYLDQLDDVTKVRYEKKLSILNPPLWVALNVYMVSGKTTIVACPGSKLFFQVLTIWGDRGSGPP